LIALRRSGDDVQISKYFGLDEWKEVTQGHTEEAARGSSIVLKIIA